MFFYVYNICKSNTEKVIIKIIVRVMKTAINYSRNDDHNEDIDVHDDNKQEDGCNKTNKIILLKIVMINHK